MDDIDIKILKLLQNNARVSASEISNQINLSVSAVSERLKKLETSGTIDQYTTIINASQFKKELTALIFINLEKPKYTNNLLEFVRSENEILECHYLAGEFDYMLKIITHNTSTLETLLKSIKNIPGVQKTRTIVVLSTMKNNYSITLDTNNK